MKLEVTTPEEFMYVIGDINSAVVALDLWKTQGGAKFITAFCSSC